MMRYCCDALPTAGVVGEWYVATFWVLLQPRPMASDLAENFAKLLGGLLVLPIASPRLRGKQCRPRPTRRPRSALVPRSYASLATSWQSPSPPHALANISGARSHPPPLLGPRNSALSGTQSSIFYLTPDRSNASPLRPQKRWRAVHARPKCRVRNRRTTRPHRIGRLPQERSSSATVASRRTGRVGTTWLGRIGLGVACMLTTRRP